MDANGTVSMFRSSPLWSTQRMGERVREEEWEVEEAEAGPVVDVEQVGGHAAAAAYTHTSDEPSVLTRTPVFLLLKFCNFFSASCFSEVDKDSDLNFPTYFRSILNFAFCKTNARPWQRQRVCKRFDFYAELKSVYFVFAKKAVFSFLSLCVIITLFSEDRSVHQLTRYRKGRKKWNENSFFNKTNKIRNIINCEWNKLCCKNRKNFVFSECSCYWWALKEIKITP